MPPLACINQEQQLSLALDLFDVLSAQFQPMQLEQTQDKTAVTA